MMSLLPSPITRRCLVALVLLGGACAPVRALTINLTYDSTVTSLPNAAQVESAVNYAAQRIQGLIVTPIAVNITVIASSDPNVFGLGEGFSAPTYYNYAQIQSALSPFENLSTTDPTNGGYFVVCRAEAKALGLIGPSSASDGTFTFGTGYNFSFDPNHRAAPGEYDFIGIAEHEITHVMGRLSGLGDIGGYQAYYPYDLFRYNSSGGKTFVWGTNDYFSIDGGTTNLDTYDNSSDPADWSSSAVGDAFIAFTPQDVQNGFSAADFYVMFVLGYSENTATVLPAITSGTSAGAQVGRSFTYTITASNGPISSYGVTSGLPSWLSVDQSTGVISGTPPASGTYSMTIVAANAQGPANTTLTITVAPAGDPFSGTSLGGGWYSSPWFGDYNNTYYPWINQASLGFIYIQTSDNTNLYLYVLNGNSGSLGWLYTTPTEFPSVYSFSKGTWLYYSAGGTSFYNFATSSWETY